MNCLCLHFLPGWQAGAAGSTGFGRQVSELFSVGTGFSGKDVEGGWNWGCVALIVDSLSVPGSAVD